MRDVRLMADDLVKDFCSQVVGMAFAAFITHSEKSKHESIVANQESILADRFFGRVHHFVYQCGNRSVVPTAAVEVENADQD